MLALALALRVAWGVVVPVVPESDSAAYDILARNIAAGDGYGFKPGVPSVYWPVGTSAIYATLYKAFGVGYGPIVALNVALGVGTVWLAMTLAHGWFGPRAGVITGLILAAWPGQIQFTTILASELPFNFLILCALYAEGRDRWPTALRIAAVGALTAGASYVRPLALAMPALLWWRRVVDPDMRRGGLVANTAEAAGVVLVVAILIAPWAARNARIFGSPVLISANGGANFWMGNNPDSNGGYMPLPPRVEKLNEVERDALLKREGRQYVLEHPERFAVGLVKKFIMTHSRESIGVVWNQAGLTRVFGRGVLGPMKLASALYFGAAMLAAVVGAVHALRRLGFRRWIGLPPIVFWAYFAAVHMATVGGDRYHYPSVPMIAALAASGIVAVFGASAMAEVPRTATDASPVA
ncbi:glycosyl transferase family 39 [Paludisphaera soli]|uniref:glycosyl transferase family 39 n=1 Tax=Paludisphaera soli TaxID=2712865 RepID=UPI0013ED7D6D|nr:glycosyl transferase family 39 [Paludisphaera soli]